MRRVLPLFALAVLLYSFAPALAQADKNTHSGRIVSVEANKFTMTATSGGKEHTHTLAPGASVSCDGKPCKLTDLKKDLFVRVTTKEGDPTMAVRVEAFTTKPPIKGQPDRLPPPPRP